MERKIIITVALSGGGRADKTNNPHIPETPEEIVDSAYKCWQAGAAIVHIHARDDKNKVTSDPEVYKRIHSMIRERCDIILQDSTGLGPDVKMEERINVIDAGAEMASLNMGTLVRSGIDDSLFLNTPSQIETYVKRMLEIGVKPELEVYNHSMFRDVETLIAKNLLTKPYLINLVLGMSYQGGLAATPKNLLSLVEYLPKEDCVFNVSAVGKAQLHLTTLSMLIGGNVRVGLEDNLYYQKGQVATNEMLAERAVRLARELQFEVATPDEARDILAIPRLS
ncbi:MAG: 3-keto-5-aminohexanoate cleavage protein [Dethiobacter sp.]|jgi:3-keto-5-aminohexanoate cleavage enzyme|nr:3-keto-5-aminohexanoate cleavage protein [Dethiobacter sp.]